MNGIQRFFFFVLILMAPAIRAAEFEVLDRFSVDGYTELRGTAAVPSGGFSVGGSTFVVKDGNVGIGTTEPVVNLDVAGGIKVGTVTSNCTSAFAGTIRWYEGHLSVCNGSNWRQLDNQPPPTITSITPASGVVTGGTAITIIGTGFSSGLELTIGGAAATGIALTGASQITAATPARTAGAQEVRITNSDGQYITGTFTYNPLPASGGPVSPASGTEGTVVTITGTDFVNGLNVTFGGLLATTNSVTATQIVAVAPVNASTGAKDITITNPDSGAVTLTGGFTYLSPTVTGVSPAYGIQGTVITITGTSFANATGLAVTIGGVSATGFTWNSATQITATVPASTASGAKAVTVTNRDFGTGTKSDGFTYMVYATGGTETASGLYRIHKFNATSAITFATGGNVEVLLVAGGGGGGFGQGLGGGGGGGGVSYSPAHTVTSTYYNVTVGNGGTAGTSQKGGNGGDSVFNTLTATGGGGGGGGLNNPELTGASGGSGGGGGEDGGAEGAGGSGVSGQGNAGGRGHTSPLYRSGGGGGAGVIGDSGLISGNGGIGIPNGISGTISYYGGGGGGSAYQAAGSPAGTGGNGGGGNGGGTAGASGTMSAGTANTGGGGGGQTSGNGAAGGSGTVIVRYSTDASFWNTAPSLTSVSPVSGSGGGGYTITLTGSGFSAPAAVTIGGITASATTINGTQIIAVVPPQTSAGVKEVKVTNQGGQYSALPTAFTASVYATGGTVAVIGGYRIHTFAGGGTFTVTSGGTVEVLVVAGGGGGGGDLGGGGGAGGLIYNSSYVVDPGQAITVTVGDGGAGGGATRLSNTVGSNGANSVFGSLTAIGGGHGGAYWGSTSTYDTGAAGGSGGGGAAKDTAGGGTGGSGTSGQGNAGGLAGYNGNYPGGGGGGAGGAGANRTGSGGGTDGGVGGVGVAYSISGASVYYAGGGGGSSFGNTTATSSPGTGGLGGGGNGGWNNSTLTNIDGINGLANTGGGGGGGAYGYGSPVRPGYGGSGGSGIVIIRYPN